MKNLLLGLCLVGLTFACKSNDSMNVDDASAPNMPAAECCEGATECSGDMSECAGDMSECSDMKAECSASKAECSAAAAECSAAAAECSAAAAECSSSSSCDSKPEGAVCPVTGKPIN